MSESFQNSPAGALIPQRPVRIIGIAAIRAYRGKAVFAHRRIGAPECWNLRDTFSQRLFEADQLA